MRAFRQRTYEGTHQRGVSGVAHTLADCSTEFCGRASEISALPETQSFDAAPDGDPETYDLVGAIIAFEDGTLDNGEVLVLFSELISSGKVWLLQGAYVRTAENLIRQGFIGVDGVIDWDVVDHLLDEE